MFVILWVHVSRIARPGLLPPRGLLWGSLGLLLALSVLWPIGMDPAADAFRIPERAVLDVFYAFWLPVTSFMPAGAVWVFGLSLTAVALAAPLWTRPAAEGKAEPSSVDAQLCTGLRAVLSRLPVRGDHDEAAYGWTRRRLPRSWTRPCA